MIRRNKWKLLLVEDDADSAEALISLFGIHHIETLWRTDGPAALALLDAIQQQGDPLPDVALLDLNLPRTNTVQLGRDLMSHASGCPVVLVSASSTQLIEKTAAQMGAVATLRKPFSMEDLEKILRQCASIENRVSRRGEARP